MIRKLLTIVMCVTLLPFRQVHAEQLVLPVPGTMVKVSSSFHPPVLKGIKINANDPFKFEFILDQGGEDVIARNAVTKALPAGRNLNKNN